MGYEIRSSNGVANKQDIYNYLTGPKDQGGYGYSSQAALGLMANMQRESGFTTAVTVIDSNGLPSGGMFQWNGPRLQGLQSAVPDWKSNPKGQLDYALQFERGESNTARAIMENGTDVNQVQAQWLTQWERPRNPSSDAVKNMTHANTLAGILTDENGQLLKNDPTIARVLSQPAIANGRSVSADIQNQIKEIEGKLAESYIDDNERARLTEQLRQLKNTANSSPSVRNGSQTPFKGGKIQDLKCNLPRAVGTNPLHNLTNYTYRLIISILTPAEYNDFVNASEGGSTASKELPGLVKANAYPKPGSILIASGGEDIAKKNEFGVQDFFFEECVVSSLTSADGGGGGTDAMPVTASTSLDFVIFEPMGTTLFERLYYAYQNISDKSYSGGRLTEATEEVKKDAAKNNKVAEKDLNLSQPVYLLSIEFKGYKGYTQMNSVNGEAQFMLDNTSTSGDYQNIFHIPFIFEKIDTDIFGSGTRYKCTAIPAASQVFFTLNQALPSTATIKENILLSKALEELSDRFNANQENLPEEFKKHKYVFRIVKDNEIPDDDRETKNIARILRESAKFRDGPPMDAGRITMMPPKTEEQKKDGRIPGNKSGTTSYRNPNDQTYHMGMGTTATQLIHQIMGKTDFFKDQAEKARSGNAETGIWWYNIRGNMLFDLDKGKSKNPHIENGKIFEYIIEPYQIFVINDIEQNQLCKLGKTFRNYEYIYTGKNNDILRWDLTFDGFLFAELQQDEPSNTSGERGQPGVNSGQAVNASGQARGTKDQTKTAFPTLSTIRSEGYMQKNYRVNYFGVTETNASAGRVVNYSEMQTAAFMESLYRQQSGNSMMSLDVEIIGDPEYLGTFNKLGYKRKEKVKKDPLNPDSKAQASLSKRQVSIELAKKSAESSGMDDNGQYLVGMRFKTPTDVDPKTLSYKGMRSADLNGIYTLNSIKHIFRNGKFTQQLLLYATDNKCCPVSEASGSKLPTQANGGQVGTRQTGQRPVSAKDKERLAQIDTDLKTGNLDPATVDSLLMERDRILNGGNNTVNAQGQIDVADPVRGGATRVSSEFGLRQDPFNPSKTEQHNGQDRVALLGTPIDTVEGGKVVLSSFVSGYGNRIEILHPDGTVTAYSHLNSRLVREGDILATGDQIGTLGSTGESTGAHLDWQLIVPKDSIYARSPGATSASLKSFSNEARSGVFVNPEIKYKISK